MKAQDPQGNHPTIKDFVLQEAQERAFEVSVIGLKEFERERAHILQQKKESIHDEIQKRNKDQLANARILKSSLINGSRMRKMQARQKNLLQILSQTEAHIYSKIIPNRSQYCKLLKQLIVQGLVKMLQPIVYVKCLKRDKQFVESIIQDAKEEFKKLIAQQGIHESVAQVQIKVDNNFLELREIRGDLDAERVEKNQENTRCFGGVILTSEDGLIVCKNTLDSRVELAFQHMLPVIRKTLFN